MDALATRFASLTTAHLTDGALRAGLPVRCAPAAVTGISPGLRFAGPARPVRHVGSVDVILEAIDLAAPGEVLVVDNDGRLDEACVGDLLVHEAHGAGLAGAVLWGLHRDTADILRIGFPVFSLGSLPTGPLRLDPRPADALERASVGPWEITADDLVAADDDGVVFVPLDRADEVFTLAEGIRDTERAQAERSVAGVSLREQVRFDVYLASRAAEPELTFREHLRRVGGEIEV